MTRKPGSIPQRVASALLALVVALGSAPPAAAKGSKRRQREGPVGDVVGPGVLIPSSVLGVAGPSGVAFHPPSGHLFVVGDKGSIAELDGQGHRLRVTAVKGDIEDVTVHTPSGNLVLLDERKARLILFDPTAFDEIGRRHLDQGSILGREPEERNKGFEGIAFCPQAGRPGGGVFYLTHQSGPALLVSLLLDFTAVRDRIDSGHVLGRLLLKGHKNLTAVTFVPTLNLLLVIDGREHELLLVDSEGEVVAHVAAPGLKPEGLAIDRRGRLWIADDAQGLLRCDGALSALTRLVSSRR
jgi:uncharacterized protein YjiK